MVCILKKYGFDSFTNDAQITSLSIGRCYYIETKDFSSFLFILIFEMAISFDCKNQVDSLVNHVDTNSYKEMKMYSKLQSHETKH